MNFEGAEASTRATPRSIDVFFDQTYRSSAIKYFPLRYWLIFFAMGMANIGGAAEFVAVAYLIPNDEFQDEILHNDMAKNGAIIASALMLGLIPGGLATGAYEGRLGRKSFILLGIVINYFSWLFSAFSPNVGILAVSHVLAGFGSGVIYSAVSSLSTELSPPSNRGSFVGFVGTFWSAGIVFGALIGFLSLSIYNLHWRIFISICTLPHLISFALIFNLVPESARFLALRGEYAMAVSRANMVAEYMGCRDKRLTLDEVYHHYLLKGKTDETENSALQNVAENGKGASDSSRVSKRFSNKTVSTLLSLFSKDLRNRTFFLLSIWIFLDIGSALGTWINAIFEGAGANQYIGAVCIAGGNVIGQVSGVVLVDKVGRKLLLVSSMALASVSLASFAWFVQDEKVHTLALVSNACLFSAFISCAWTPNVVMTGELFPTTVRNAGSSVCATCGRLSCVLAQFINGLLVERPALLLTVASAAFMAGVLTAISLKVEDMSGKPLSDTVALEEAPCDYKCAPSVKDTGGFTVEESPDLPFPGCVGWPRLLGSCYSCAPDSTFGRCYQKEEQKDVFLSQPTKVQNYDCNQFS